MYIISDSIGNFRMIDGQFLFLTYQDAEEAFQRDLERGLIDTIESYEIELLEVQNG